MRVLTFYAQTCTRQSIPLGVPAIAKQNAA